MTWLKRMNPYVQGAVSTLPRLVGKARGVPVDPGVHAPCDAICEPDYYRSQLACQHWTTWVSRGSSACARAVAPPRVLLLLDLPEVLPDLVAAALIQVPSQPPLLQLHRTTQPVKPGLGTPSRLVTDSDQS